MRLKKPTRRLTNWYYEWKLKRKCPNEKIIKLHGKQLFFNLHYNCLYCKVKECKFAGEGLV